MKRNILTVFIAWVNLDFGFETCFYDRMDGYAKTWLQLVFPSHIILLTIYVCSSVNTHNDFQCLFQPKTQWQHWQLLFCCPTYTKLLHLIIAGISYSPVLHFNNDSQSIRFVWENGWEFTLLGRETYSSFHHYLFHCSCLLGIYICLTLLAVSFIMSKQKVKKFDVKSEEKHFC